jgi:hypothetical protein
LQESSVSEAFFAVFRHATAKQSESGHAEQPWDQIPEEPLKNPVLVET